MGAHDEKKEKCPSGTMQIRREEAIISLAAGIDLIDAMKKEEFVKKVLGKDELPIGHYPQARVYAIKIPAAVRREGGIGIPSRVTGKTREIVIDKLFDIFIHRNTGKSDKITLTALFDEFIAVRENDPDFAAHTVRKNICDWNTFFKGTEIALAPVAMITPTDLHDHFKAMTEGRRMTRHAFGNAKGLLNQLFDLAFSKNLVPRNICRELSTRDLKFKPEDCKQELVYTSEERERICNELADSVNVHDNAIIMQFCLGCRVSEVKALYWSDIDFEHKLVRIDKEVVDGRDGELIVKHQTKSGMTEGNRILPLTKRAERMLSRIPKPEDKDSLIFQKDYKPLRTQTINDHLREVCRKLGIRYLSSHKIRVWGITTALDSGMGQASIMRIAGHASPQTMRHYIRTARIQTEIRDNFDSVFN